MHTLGNILCPSVRIVAGEKKIMSKVEIWWTCPIDEFLAS